MHSNGRYSATRLRTLLLLIVGILILGSMMQGCSTTLIAPEIEHQEADDEGELDASVFFHDGTKGIEAQVRDDDAEKASDPVMAMPEQVQMAAGRASTLSKVVPVGSLSEYEAPEIPVTSVSAGGNHSLLVDVYGNVWSAGKGNYGQLGNGLRSSSRFLPVRMESDIEEVSAGDSHSLLLSSAGEVFAFGDNNYFQLGLENPFMPRMEPVVIAHDMQAIAAGFDHSHLLDIEGNLYRVGNQTDIELQIPGQSGGLFSQNNNYIFTISAEPNLVAPVVVKFASDMRFTLYIQEDLRLWASGKNEYGQLGDGTTQDRLYPEFVMYDVVKVSTGLYHTLILGADNRLWSVGKNDHGQLGNGTRASSSDPIYIMDNILDIDAGATHSMALDSDGVLWGFGAIYLEEMPPGSDYGIIAPFPLLRDVATFSAGYGFTLAVTNDGSLWVLGDNKDGQLGLESPEFVRRFTRVDLHLPELVADTTSSVEPD